MWKKANQQQQHWDKGRHLHSIQSRVGMLSSRVTKRKEQVTIIRLSGGHSNLNSTLYIIGKHPRGLCHQCHEAETPEHMLISCRKFTQEEMMTQLR